MVYFQFVFAAITVVILAGALLGRMNPLAWVVFIPLWLTFSYSVGAFSIWAGGFLFQRGVIEFVFLSQVSFLVHEEVDITLRHACPATRVRTSSI